MALSQQNSATHGIDPAILDRIGAREERAFLDSHPKSTALFRRAEAHLPHGVPLHWMSQWGTPHPIYAARAKGAWLEDVDGHHYIDFCLGDSAALFGHSPPPVAAAIAESITGRGASYMLPTEDGVAVAEELARRFGLPFWQVAVSATDANRFAIRLARILTGRRKILVFNGKYHGSVDETQAELRDGKVVPQHGIDSNGLDLTDVTKVVEFNDVEALERALADRDVAAVLAEPHMTNIGMIPAMDGFHAALRRVTRETGTLLIIDETHTICLGPGGGTAELGLEPDMLVLGKVLAAGIPSAVYGLSDAIGKRVKALTAGPGINHYGFGGTLAANALTLRAIRASLEEVMTEATYGHMVSVAKVLEEGIRARIGQFSLPWHVSRMGARVEYLYRPTVPRNGSEAGAARDDRIELLTHLYFLNRGVLMSPFHNMLLASPATGLLEAKRFDEIFARLLEEFTAP